MTTQNTTTTTLGDLISVLYEEFLAVYGDEELASVAVAATINDLLTEEGVSGADLGSDEAAA
jgi:hypothetical protein